MEKATHRIEVFCKTDDYRGEVIKQKLQKLGFSPHEVYTSDNYLLYIDIPGEKAEQLGQVLSQPVTQDFLVNKPYAPEQYSFAIEIGFLPGVTDNVAHTVRESIGDFLNMELDHEKSVFSSVTYFLQGNLSKEDAEEIGKELYNPLIERITILSGEEYKSRGGMGTELPVVHIMDRGTADEVNLALADDELMVIAKEGIADNDGSRRGPLALDLPSMHVIKDYFLEREKRNPRDIELESIAQTWSEHCKHTIFAADMDDDIKGGIYKQYIREATIRIRREKGDKDFCVSVFVDNAGGIVFDENYIIADKVETHNSPSALDPFGGSITGIVGVNRDAIGFGMASKPIANRYGFCFADPFDERPLYRNTEKSTKLLSPRRIMEGVIHGVNVGGNTSGIPTPQGFVYFDERFKGKPLVFVGTIGLLPVTVNGKAAVSKKAMPGDSVVIIGGRVGRDGIHGATFSSEALNSGSPATAVQIGDPITQKKLSDAVVKEARDMGLYHSITDNGAGGLSCSVAEMARESGGFEVDLETIPLKYHGLAPWQIWVSESQERMTLSVPDESVQPFIDLMNKRGVESAVIGKFTDGTRGIVRYNGEVIFDLDMTFLHEGLPVKQLRTTYTRQSHDYPEFPEPEMTSVFLDMISRQNTASFEFITFQYDHEVQANSVIKPVQGKGKVNGNASVIRPVLDSQKGAVLSQGLYPSYSDIDTYWMAACSIDTAIRNAVSAGGSLDEMALLDNFCWCDSNNPERLGQLKEAARACYDFAVAYGTPFVSGKDSMFNDFKGYDENFNEVLISIPPTLLVSSIGVIEDINICQTIDFKFTGDCVYVLGTTADETGGSEYLAYMGEKLSGSAFIGNSIPKVDTESFTKLYRSVEQAMKEELLASCISIERGGLSVALAKSAMAGMLGASVDLSAVPGAKNLRNDTILFSESQGRFLVSVDHTKKDRFEQVFSGLPFGLLGEVTGSGILAVKGTNGDEIVNTDVNTLLEKYKGVFKEF
ncbi:MAG: phosphoribosylformylglycinamidine synthase [bacterium]|nr:phosphoribosylformylglycinamidine synthase [bacterium]